MKLVRRARKNIRERRMKACLNDLNANLSKVEMKVFLKQKQERERKRMALSGVRELVPKSILAGRMTPELYAIECRLHEEAGLPKPVPYPEYVQDVRAMKKTGGGGIDGEFSPLLSLKKPPWIGFVPFSALLTAVNERYRVEEKSSYRKDEKKW